jgi:glycosyltransferase involved in cell wall biosynthesis
MTRLAPPDGRDDHSELVRLRAREADFEAQIERLTFERDGYYGEWRHARNQLDAIRHSPVWPLWLLWRLVRAVLSLPLAAFAALPRWLAGVWLVAWSCRTRLRAWRRAPPPAIPDPPPLPRAADPDRRPRVLLVSPYPIHPPHHGGAVRLHNLVRRLGERARLHLLIFSQQGEDPAQRAALEPFCVRLDFHRWRPQLRPDWRGLQPPSALIFASPLAEAKVRDLVIGYNIDVVQLEYTELGQYAAAVPEGVPVILTEHDIAFRSFARRRRLGFQRRFPEGRAFGTTRHDQRRLMRYELASDRAVAQIHTMSEDDGRYLARHLADGARRIRVVPNGVDTAWYAPAGDPPPRRGVLYVGNFQNLPNVDALEHFVADTWPLVRLARPEACLSVVGANVPERVQRLDGRDGIAVVGEVDDLRPVYHRHRVMVAPIRAGSGTRLKILEAFAAGTPVVSTTLGAEGIESEPGRHLLLADSAADFAAAIEQVLADDQLARRLAAEGMSLVRERYDWSLVADRLLACWEELLVDVHPLRRATPQDVVEAIEPRMDAGAAPPAVSVLILTRDGGGDLERCLSAVAAQRGAPAFELVCVDSGSRSTSVETMRRHGARVLRIDSNRFNPGLTRDLAARHARGEVLVFLGQDAVPADAEWLRRLVEPLQSGDETVAAVQGGARAAPDGDRQFFWDSNDDRSHLTRVTARWLDAYRGIGLATVNCALRRACWQRHNFGWAMVMEDKKWQREVVDAGFRIVGRDDAAVHRSLACDLGSLARRYRAEGWGWRSLDIRYTLWDAIRDVLRPGLYRTLLGGLVRGRVRTPAELAFPWLRPLALWWGNRWP